MRREAPLVRSTFIRWLIGGSAMVLFGKVLFDILAEYRWYFPADFDRSAFLAGRRFTFVALYRVAFYAHLLCGPPAVLLALFLLLTGGKPRIRAWHRAAGKSLVLIVLVFLVPSGLVMAREAYAGQIAALGFAALAVATGAYTAATAYFARRKNFRAHQRFAVPTFILLASPLLLRVASGFAIVADCESELFYQLNAWLSWLVPLAIYELSVNWAAFGKWRTRSIVRNALNQGDPT